MAWSAVESSLSRRTSEGEEVETPSAGTREREGCEKSAAGMRAARGEERERMAKEYAVRRWEGEDEEEM